MSRPQGLELDAEQSPMRKSKLLCVIICDKQMDFDLMCVLAVLCNASSQFLKNIILWRLRLCEDVMGPCVWNGEGNKGAEAKVTLQL